MAALSTASSSLALRPCRATRQVHTIHSFFFFSSTRTSGTATIAPAGADGATVTRFVTAVGRWQWQRYRVSCHAVACRAIASPGTLPFEAVLFFQSTLLLFLAAFPARQPLVHCPGHGRGNCHVLRFVDGRILSMTTPSHDTLSPQRGADRCS
jgi:hypothetical protein